MKLINKLFSIPTVEYTEIPYKDWKDSQLDILGGRVIFRVQGCFMYRIDNVSIRITADINTGNKEEYKKWENKLKDVGFKKSGSPYAESVHFKDIEVNKFSMMIKELEGME